MPRPKTPLAKARLTGAIANHPERYRDAAAVELSGKALGPAPTYLDRTQRAAWGVLAAELPWLVHEDRAAVELAAVMRARIMSRADDLTASFLGGYRGALSALGATPTDRGRIAGARLADGDADPFAFLEAPRQ